MCDTSPRADSALIKDKGTAHGQHIRSPFQSDDMGGISRRCRWRGGGWLPSKDAAAGGGHPERAGPQASRPERDFHAAQGRGPGRDPLRGVRGQDAGNAHHDRRVEPRRAQPRLRAHADDVPALPCRLQLRRQVRHPQLDGRRPRQRPGDYRARCRRRHRKKVPGLGVRTGDRGLREAGLAANGGGGPRHRDHGGRGVQYRAVPRPGHGGADDRAHQGGPQGRRFSGRRRGVRGA